MAGESRIPVTIRLFNPYIRNTDGYMLEGTPLNWIRLGWSQEWIDKWSDIHARWRPLHSKYSNKEETRTTSIKNQLLALIRECKDYDKEHHLLDTIAASPNGIISDMETFHIKKGLLQDNTHTVGHTPLKDEVFAIIISIGGGEMEIKCRTANDSSKPSKPKGMDCVQYVYQIGGTPPTSAAVAGLIKDSSTKASFVLHLGADKADQKLYIFFRWYSTKHPELSGPWSTIQTKMIL